MNYIQIFNPFYYAPVPKPVDINANNNNSILQLPTDIQRHIFSFVPYYSSGPSITCRKWNYIIEEEYYRKAKKALELIWLLENEMHKLHGRSLIATMTLQNSLSMYEGSFHDILEGSYTKGISYKKRFYILKEAIIDGLNELNYAPNPFPLTQTRNKPFLDQLTLPPGICSELADVIEIAKVRVRGVLNLIKEEDVDPCLCLLAPYAPLLFYLDVAISSSECQNWRDTNSTHPRIGSKPLRISLDLIVGKKGGEAIYYTYAGHPLKLKINDPTNCIGSYLNYMITQEKKRQSKNQENYNHLEKLLVKLQKSHPEPLFIMPLGHCVIS